MTHAFILLEASLRLQFTTTQALVLQHVWQGKTYTQIAKQAGYSTDYVKSVGSHLWRTLSKRLDQPVNKSNVRSVLRQYMSDRALASSLKGSGATIASPVTSSSVTSSPVTSSPVTSSSITSSSITSSSITSGTGLNSASVPFSHPVFEPTLDSRLHEWNEKPPQFWGRLEELTVLQNWLTSKRYRVISILGMGGMGKTALAMQCALSMQSNMQTGFEAVLWRSLRHFPSVDDLLSDLLQTMTGCLESDLPISRSAKLSALIHSLRQHRYLLVLDQWDALFQCQGLKENTFDAVSPSNPSLGNDKARHHKASQLDGYRNLLRYVLEESHQSCVLLTSREKPIELLAQNGEGQPGRSLTLKTWDTEAVQALFESSSVTLSSSMAKQLVHQYNGNVLALKSLASVVRDVFHQDATAIFTQKPLIFGAIATVLEQHIRQLSMTELSILQILADHPSGCTLDQLRTHLTPTLSRQQLLETILNVQSKSLIVSNEYQFTIPCLLGEYLKRPQSSPLSASA